MKNTVRRINLEGELGEKFGKVWHLNVKSPAEAIHAIEAQRKGLRKYFLDTGEKGIGYEVIVGDQGIQQEEGLLYPAPMRDDFTFVPVPQGGKSRGFGMILAGVMLMIPGLQLMSMEMIGAGGVTLTGMSKLGFIIANPGTFGMVSASTAMGAGLIFGGVSQLLAPPIESNTDGNEEQSYLFDGAVNSAKQGTPVPILYGRLTVGGAVISASIKSNQETSRVPGLTRIFVAPSSGSWYFLTTGGGPGFPAPGGNTGSNPTGSGMIL